MRKCYTPKGGKGCVDVYRGIKISINIQFLLYTNEEKDAKNNKREEGGKKVREMKAGK